MNVPLRLLLVALCAAAVMPFFVGLGASSIWDANEAFYVETPREMLESGDYINPSFNYEPRFNKPVLSYWIVAALYQLFGVSVAVQRLAIAGAAMAMVVAVWWLARAASTHALAPLLAALGLAAGPRFFMFSRRILVDMAITAAMTLVLLFFALAERDGRRRRRYLVLMYVSVGVGVLIKGPVAVVIPALVFGAYLTIHRELHRIREMMIPAGVAIVAAIVVPWYAALYAQHGWTHIVGFFIGENVGRFTETVGVQARPPWFYLPVLLADMLPWSLCLPAVAMAWWRDRRASPRDSGELRVRTLLLLWVGVTVVFFSASQTKQDLYIFPVIAAVAALGGDWVARALHARRASRAAEPEDSAVRWLSGTLVLLGIVIAALGGAVLFLFGGTEPVYRIDGARLAGGMAVAGGLATAALASLNRQAAAVCSTLAVFVTFNWILALVALPGFERYKPVVPLSQVIAERTMPGDVVAHVEVALPSMVFYLRRHIDVWPDREGFLQDLERETTFFAVMPEDVYVALKPRFGATTCIAGRHPTADIRLRGILERRPPPEVFVVTNRCPAG